MLDFFFTATNAADGREPNVRERGHLRNGIVRPAEKEISLDRDWIDWRDVFMHPCPLRGFGALAVLALALCARSQLAADPPLPGTTPLHLRHGYGLKGLALWITAEDGITADAQSHVTQLVDKTGNFTLTPPNGGPGPTQAPKALNGHAVLRFTGSESLYSADSFGVAVDHAMTFIIVSRGTAPADAEQFVLYLGQNSDPHCNRSLCHFQGKEFFDGQFVGCFGEPVLRNVFFVDGASLNSARSRATFYQNGRQVLSSRLSLLNGNAQFDQVSDGVTLGAAPTNLYGWQGDVAEALVFDRELTPAEMRTVSAALVTKYALKDPPAPGAK
jgi:hypothetical protein